MTVLAVSSAVGSIGLGAGGTAGGLLAAELADTSSVSGLPLGVLVLGSAGGALLIARFTRLVGRRRSLAGGYLVGAAGAICVVAGAARLSLTGLLVGSLFLGAANAAIFLTRYAAAEIAGEREQGRALGIVLFGTSIGAVASPLLLGPSGDLAAKLGLPPLSGLFVVAAIGFCGAAAILVVRDGERRSVTPTATSTKAQRTVRHLRRAAPLRIGVALLAGANLVMVGVMVTAPVHLSAHGHGFGQIGTTISLHVAAMFALSPLSGWAADRWSAPAVAAAGCPVMAVAGVAGALADPSSAAQLTLVLVLLGTGWNFTVVGGSALIVRSAPPALRVDAEALGEVTMGIAAATAAPAAGLVMAFGGFTAVSLLAAALATVAFAGARRGGPQTPPAPASEPESAM